MSDPTRRDVLSTVAGGLTVAAAARPARATGRPVTVASLLGDDKPETRIWLRMRELLERRLPGRLDLRIVGNAALGAEREVAEGARLGSVQASLSTLAALSAWVPQGQILDLPFVYRDRAHLARVTAGPTGAELRTALEQQGFHVLGFVNYGARHLLAKQPLTTPAQVAGKRIRVIQSPLHTALWRAYGANPTPIPITETYNALQTGVVDAMDLTKSAYAGFRLYEVVPVVIETRHIWSVGVAYVSAGFWRQLEADEQTAWSDAGAEATAYFDRLMVDDETASMETARAAGATTVTPEDLPAWEAGARAVWKTFGPTLGGMATVEALRAA